MCTSGAFGKLRTKSRRESNVDSKGGPGAVPAAAVWATVFSKL